jgi:hypothetical protein
MNAEYRTNINVNHRHHPNRRANNNSITRCCSFCRRSGHNINLCNDQRLHDFHNLCRYKKIEFENSVSPMDSFKEWIYEYWSGNEQIVKAYAVNRCGALMRYRTFDLIESIMIYFYGDEYILGDTLPPLISETDEEEDTEENIINTIEFIRDYRTFMMLLRAVTQPDLITTSERKFTIQSELNEIESEDICQCNICFEDFNVTNFVKLNCKHEFCKDCIKQTLKSCNSFTDPTCAYCRTPISVFGFKNNDVQNEFSEMII